MKYEIKENVVESVEEVMENLDNILDVIEQELLKTSNDIESQRDFPEAMNGQLRILKALVEAELSSVKEDEDLVSERVYELIDERFGNYYDDATFEVVTLFDVSE